MQISLILKLKVKETMNKIEYKARFENLQHKVHKKIKHTSLKSNTSAPGF